MSTRMPMVCVPVDPADVPSGALEPGFQFVDRLVKGDDMLYAESRNHFLAWAADKMAANYGLQSLSFVCGAPWEQPGRELGVLFTAAQIDRVVADIDQLFALIADDPQRFLDIDSHMGCCATHLLAYVEGATASLKPMIDDGDTMDSVFNFLRSFQALCRRARDAGHHVLYVQFDA
jgi:hypothetical protein